MQETHLSKHYSTMAKKAIKQQHTEVHTPTGLAHNTEVSVVSDDSILPSPADLQAYQAIHPGFVEYFITTASKEQEHRHTIEKQNAGIIQAHVKAEANARKLSLWFAFILMLAFCVLGAFMIYIGHEYIGIGAFLTSLVSSWRLFFPNAKENQSQKSNDSHSSSD